MININFLVQYCYLTFLLAVFYSQSYARVDLSFGKNRLLIIINPTLSSHTRAKKKSKRNRAPIIIPSYKGGHFCNASSRQSAKLINQLTRQLPKGDARAPPWRSREKEGKRRQYVSVCIICARAKFRGKGHGRVLASAQRMRLIKTRAKYSATRARARFVAIWQSIRRNLASASAARVRLSVCGCNGV